MPTYGDKRKHSDKGMDPQQKMLDKTGGETPEKPYGASSGGSGGGSNKPKADSSMKY